MLLNIRKKIIQGVRRGSYNLDAIGYAYDDLKILPKF